MDYPSNRKEAQRLKTTHYFTGVPCSKGHIALRKTKGVCVECLRIEWKISNDKRKLLPKSEAAKEAGLRYYERNRQQVIARAQARPKEDKQRYKQTHKSSNKEYYKVLTNLRRRRHRSATPKWLSYKQRQDIKHLYAQAVTLSQITGVRYVVDHIVPLINDSVCGLHVPWNLRVITQEENLAKSNKL